MKEFLALYGIKRNAEAESPADRAKDGSLAHATVLPLEDRLIVPGSFDAKCQPREIRLGRIESHTTRRSGTDLLADPTTSSMTSDDAPSIEMLSASLDFWIIGFLDLTNAISFLRPVECSVKLRFLNRFTFQRATATLLMPLHHIVHAEFAQHPLLPRRRGDLQGGVGENKRAFCASAARSPHRLSNQFARE